MKRLWKSMTSGRVGGTQGSKAKSSRQMREESGTFGTGRITWSNTSFGDWLNTFPALKGVTRYKDMKRDYREHCATSLAENFYEDMGFDNPEDAKVAILNAPAFKQITKEFKDVVLKDIELGPESHKVQSLVKEAKGLQAEARKIEAEAKELYDAVEKAQKPVDETNEQVKDLRAKAQAARKQGNTVEADRLEKRADVTEHNGQEDRGKLAHSLYEFNKVNDKAQQKHFAAYKLFKEAASKGSYEGLQGRAFYKRVGISDSKAALVKKNVTQAKNMLENFKGLPKQQALLGKADKLQREAEQLLDTAAKLRKRGEGFSRQLEALGEDPLDAKERRRLESEVRSSFEGANNAYIKAQEKHYEAYGMYLKAGQAGSSAALFEAAKYQENGIQGRRAPDSFMANMPLIGGEEYHHLAPNSEAALELTKRAMALGPQRSIVASIGQYQRAMQLYAENPADPKVLELLEQSSAYGYAPASSMLGRIYMEGLGGVPVDIEKADKYFWRAVELSPKHTPMLHHIAMLYWEYAQDVPKENEKQYFNHIQKAASYFARAGNRRSIDDCLFASARYTELATVYKDNLEQLKLRNRMAKAHQASPEQDAPRELQALTDSLEDVRSYLGSEDTTARFFGLEGDWARKIAEMERLSRMYKDFAVRLGWPGEDAQPAAPRVAPPAPALPPVPPLVPAPPVLEDQPPRRPVLLDNSGLPLLPIVPEVDYVPGPVAPVPIPPELTTRREIVDYILFVNNIITPEDREAFFQTDLGQRLQQVLQDETALAPELRSEFIRVISLRVQEQVQQQQLAQLIPEGFERVAEQVEHAAVVPGPLVPELLAVPESRDPPQLDTQELEQRLQDFMQKKTIELQEFFQRQLEEAISKIEIPAPQVAPAPEPQVPVAAPTYNTIINVNIFNIKNVRNIILRRTITRRVVKKYFINPQANLSPEAEARVIDVIIDTLNEWKAQNQPKPKPRKFRVASPGRPKVRFPRAVQRPAPQPAPQAVPPPVASVPPTVAPSPAPAAQAKRPGPTYMSPTASSTEGNARTIQEYMENKHFKGQPAQLQKFLLAKEGIPFDTTEKLAKLLSGKTVRQIESDIDGAVQQWKLKNPPKPASASATTVPVSAPVPKIATVINREIGTIHEYLLKTKFKSDGRALNRFLGSSKGKLFAEDTLRASAQVQSPTFVKDTKAAIDIAVAAYLKG